MKAVFFGIFLVLVLMTVGALVTIPDRDSGGRRTLVWVTDANPARENQIRLFEQFAPALTATVDSGNLDTSKVIVQSSAGVGPDLIDCYSSSQTDAYVRTGIIWDLTEIAAEFGFGPDLCWPGARSIMFWEGRQYTFPTNCGCMALFYNKDIFDKAGIPYPNSDWTWQEFVETAAALTKKKESGRGYERFALRQYWWMEAVWQAGGSFYSADGTRCTLDTPEAKEALRFWNDLSRRWNICPDAVQMAGLAGDSVSYGGGDSGLFLAGRFAMHYGGRWNQIAWRRANAERARNGQAPFRYGVVGLPRHRRRASRFVARATAINQHGKRRDDALQFLRFLASEPYCRDINMSADGVSAVRRYAQTVDQVWNPEYPAEKECDAEWLKLMEYAVGMETSPFVIPDEANRIANEAISALQAGQLDPETAADDMAARINAKILDNVQRFDHLRREYEKRTGRIVSAR